MDEYDLIADWYAADRTHSTGVPETQRLLEMLPARSRVLDVGCGNGIPITRAVAAAGHRVVGLDSSVEMLRKFGANCPGAPAVRARVQACPFTDASFDAAVAWGVLFHLRPEEQNAAFSSVAHVLKPGAPFLFTSGNIAGGETAVEGMMNGVTFHYYSFDEDGYRRLLDAHGLRLETVSVDAGQNTYYLARRALSRR